MFKRLFCTHNFKLERTIYGDEIIGSGWKRSIWKCDKCEKTKLSESINELR